MQALEHFFDLNQLSFWASHEAENEFAVPRDHIKHPFLELIQVSFWAHEGAENEFEVHWKYRFIDLQPIRIRLPKRQKMSSK